MAIADGYKHNFSQLLAAHDDLCLMECSDKATGQPVVVVCACVYDDDTGEYVMTPFAKMFDGNPYDEVDPPA